MAIHFRREWWLIALTRKFLSALGIEAEKIDEIINAHAETVDALKEERDKFRSNAEAYEAEQKKVAELEKQVETLKDSTKESYKVKYEALKEEFSDYKKGIENEKTKTIVKSMWKFILIALVIEGVIWLIATALHLW